MVRRRLYSLSSTTSLVCGQHDGLSVTCLLKDVPEPVQAIRSAHGTCWRGRRSPKGTLTLLIPSNIPCVLVCSGNIWVWMWEYCMPSLGTGVQFSPLLSPGGMVWKLCKQMLLVMFCCGKYHGKEDTGLVVVCSPTCWDEVYKIITYIYIKSVIVSYLWTQSGKCRLFQITE